MTSSNAFTAALRLLKTRERSEKELAGRLQRKGFAAEAVNAAIERCRELGYVDDGRFASGRARQLLASGRAVGPRLRRELHNAGVAEEVVEQALAELNEDYSEAELLVELLQRRYPAFDYQQADDREKRRVVNYFLRRGFALATVMDQLKQQA